MEFGKKYLSFKEYQDLGGELQEMPFNIFELEARKNIDKYTFGRLIDLDTQVTEVKLCVFNLINKLESYKSYDNQDKSISSINTDGYSESYNGIDKTFVEGKQGDIQSTINSYLNNLRLEDGTPYLYRGV